MRLFIAIDLPENVRERLARVQRKLQLEAREVRWLPPAQMHLTLLFLGETEEGMADAIGAEMQGAAAVTPGFELEVRGLRAFRKGRGVGVIWAGLAPCAALQTLQQALTERLGAPGGEARRKAFAPHITLGRVRVPRPNPALDAAMERCAEYACEPFPVDAMHLYRSELTPAGAVHTRLVTARVFGDQ